MRDINLLGLSGTSTGAGCWIILGFRFSVRFRLSFIPACHIVMEIALVSHPNCRGLIFFYGFGLSFSNVSGLLSVRWLRTELWSYAGLHSLLLQSLC